MSTERNIKDDHYKIIHTDIEKIIARPTMYITAVGEAALATRETSPAWKERRTVSHKSFPFVNFSPAIGARS